MLIAPACNKIFSVKVVLPASGCEIIAKVRLLSISSGIDLEFPLSNVILGFISLFDDEKLNDLKLMKYSWLIHLQ